MLAQRVSLCIFSVIAIGLIATAPARADELIDVAVLEAQVEAAAELVELPTEPDWGVPDHSNSLPAVSQDAPEVPAPPSPLAEAPQETRYHVNEPQYRAEYQPPEPDPAPPPVTEQAPVEAAAEPSSEPAPPPATPSPQEVPAQPQTPSAPTIWIWVWNWTWVQGSDERYRNSDDQYQIETLISEADLPRIVEEISGQMPIQISVQTGSDIADEILHDISPEAAPVEAAPVASAPAEPVDAYRAPPETRRTKPVSPRRHARNDDALARPYVAAPHPLTTTSAAPTPSKTSGPERPRARRASRRAPSLPLPGERLADSGAATGASASLFKTIAVLVLSLLLAAFGYGRRIWLPAGRWRGLLGTRTDPPG